MPTLHRALSARGDQVEILDEPVDHSSLTPFTDGHSRLAERLRECATLVLQRIVVSSDDRRRWQPVKIGQNRVDRRIVWRDIPRQPLRHGPPQRVDVKTPAVAEALDARSVETQIGVRAGKQQPSGPASTIALP